MILLASASFGNDARGLLGLFMSNWWRNVPTPAICLVDLILTSIEAHGYPLFLFSDIPLPPLVFKYIPDERPPHCPVL